VHSAPGRKNRPIFSHILSGVVFFGHFAPEGQNVWLYSIIYNVSFLLPSLIIVYLILISLKRFYQSDQEIG